MMLKKATLLLFFFAFIGTFSSYAQHIAINNNLLFDMTGALSLGVEIPSSRMSSFDVYGSIRPWKRGN